MWSKQFYYYVVEDWLDGDLQMLPPPPSRQEGRNSEWRDLFNRDVLSVPDTWEYPWYASWDTAFHMICFARLDPEYEPRGSSFPPSCGNGTCIPAAKIPAYEFQLVRRESARPCVGLLAGL